MSLGINVMTYDVITVTTVPVSCNVLVYPINTKLLILVCEVAVVSFVEVNHWFLEGGWYSMYYITVYSQSQKGSGGAIP